MFFELRTTVLGVYTLFSLVCQQVLLTHEAFQSTLRNNNAGETTPEAEFWAITGNKLEG